MKFESFSDLFKPPFLVAKESGEVKELVPDPSIEPRLVLVFDPPIADDVPVALVTLSDGGGAFVRFDSWPLNTQRSKFPAMARGSPRKFLCVV